jgi:hypothetical protein
MQAIVQKKLESILVPEGFEWLPEWKQFRRTWSGGFDNLIISWTQYPEDALLELHIGVRHDRIEQIAYPYSLGVKGYQPHSNTLIVSLGKLKPDASFRHVVTDEASTQATADLLAEQLQAHGFAFWERFRTLEAVEETLNEAPDAPCPYLYNAYNRILRGTVAAHLLRRPNYPQLIQTYYLQLHRPEVPQQQLLRYRELLTFLEGFGES